MSSEAAALTFLYGVMIAVGFLAVWQGVMVQRHTHAMRELLAEVQRCNAEFAEAVSLYEYGAVEEALEVAARWKKRADAE